MQANSTYQNIYRWDIDKTYLSNEFESVRDLLRTAFEKPEEKENVPGTVALIKELRHGPGLASQHNPIYFVSASPEQMRGKLIQKLKLDGVEWDGVILKNQLTHVRRMRFKRLRKHIGYKVGALLRSRASLPVNKKEILFGDDSEKDIVIYSLYSDLASRRIVGAELRRLLQGLEVFPDEIEEIFHLIEELPIHDPTERIYINLSRNTDPNYFSKFGRRVIPTINTFQAAVHLQQTGKISSDGLVRVSREMMEKYGFSTKTFGASLGDLYERGFI